MTATVSLEVAPDVCVMVTSNCLISTPIVPWRGAMNDGVAVLAPMIVTSVLTAAPISIQENLRSAFGTPGAMFLAESDTRVPGRTKMSVPASAVMATGSVGGGTTTIGATLSGQIFDGTGVGIRPRFMVNHVYSEPQSKAWVDLPGHGDN